MLGISPAIAQGTKFDGFNFGFGVGLAASGVEGMEILKLTFDIDEQARVVEKDIFAARVVSGKVEYSEFVDGRYEVADCCFACYESNKTVGLFFKIVFAGREFADKR